MPESDQSAEKTTSEPSSRLSPRRWTGRSNQPDPEQMIEPTPIYISQRVRLIIILASVFIVILMLRLVPGIVSTILLGSTLALVLSFPVRLLQKKFSRRASITIVTLTLLSITVIVLSIVVPLLISEITKFVSALPSMVDVIMRHSREFLNDLYERGYIRKSADEILSDVRYGIVDSAQSIIGTALNNLVGTLSASVSVFITAFGVVFVAIYLLADIPKFFQSYLRLWAPDYRTDAKVLWDTMGYSLSRYLSALALSLAIQGMLAFLGLSFLGVPYAVVLGLVQAITAILPYIGAWIAFVPAVLVAFTVSWQTAVGVGILYLALNQVEGSLITPNLQGNAVKVHPILIFIGVIGGGQLFGIMGAILAVPTIALIRVISEFYWLRIRVREDQPTVLALMRNDTATERIHVRSTAAEHGERSAAAETGNPDIQS